MTRVTQARPSERQRGFLHRLAEGVRSCEMTGHRVLVGVSGGPDSVALLRGLELLSAELSLTLCVGHVDHGLRGAESTEDARWVDRLAETLGIAFNVEATDPLESGSEEAARETRYKALQRMARQRHCQMIAVAHTRDDQVETVLHHVLRGTGVLGLRGMSGTHEMAGGELLVRPLLDVARSEVQSWLQEHEWDYREDATNHRREFTRNRIRHELLPLLVRDYNPRVAEALSRLARQADEAQSVIDELVDDVLARCVLEVTPMLVRLDAAQFSRQPPYLVCECLKQLWTRQGWPRGSMTCSSWQRGASVSISGGAVDLGAGVSLRRRGDVVVVSRQVSVAAGD